MFIQTEATPNPATLKFLPGRDVLGSGTMEFASVEAAAASPLASALFAVDGVAGVMLGADFLAVAKAEGAEWAELKPSVLAAIMDHFLSGAPVLTKEAASGPGAQVHGGSEPYEGAAKQIVDQIVELLDSRVRPAVAQDGGDILFDRYDAASGTVFLHMRGACAGCPASTMTLKNGVENMLRHYIPEVQAVEATL